MSNNKLRYVLSLNMIMVVFSLVFVGCKSGGITLGQAIPGDIQVSKLADVLEKATVFNGKTVVMKGIVVGQCASLCEFFFKDGAHQVTIYPQGFKFPKLETGKKVTIYALVTSGDANVAFSALGIQTE